MRSSTAMSNQVAEWARKSQRARGEIEAYILSNIRPFHLRKSIDDVRQVRVTG
jgi:hypothetical protein